jgi:hypothetical protein
MPVGIDQVRHDAASLYQFIDSIASDCQRIEQYPSYTKPSKLFFTYIHDLAFATKAYVADFVNSLDPASAVADPQDFYSRTQVIRTLRMSWFELHNWVKPALDADTLHFPFSLVKALTARLQSLAGFKNAEFAVLHSTQLNYFQIGARQFRDFAQEIGQIVPSAPPFPSNLGIIALPYSQSSNTFLNIALAHEMGHFVFQERNEAARLTSYVLAEIQRAAAQPLANLDFVWSKDRVLQWCEEIYCDLFALWLIGPSFSFAFIELFAYSRLAPRATQSGGTLAPIASLSAFYDSHPAPAFRLGEHVRFLKSPDVDWWDKIESGTSHYLQLLSEAEALPQSIFGFSTSHQQSQQYQTDLNSITLRAFWGVMDRIRDAISSTFAGVSSESNLFKQLREPISEYLSYGVVPSRIVLEGNAITPSVAPVVNAAHLFYLEQLDTLINRIRGAQVECLDCRALWSERVEMWTSKALEDITA